MPKVTSDYVPKYRKHNATGQGRVEIEGRTFYLGPYKSKASYLEYDRIINEWLANGRRLIQAGDQDAITVIELIAAYKKKKGVVAETTNEREVARLKAAAFTIRAEAAGRDFTTDETAQLDDILGKIKNIEGDGQPRPLTRRAGASSSQVRAAPSEKVRNRFPGAKLSSGAWQNFGEFALTVGRRQSDQRFFDAMEEGSGAAGGYAVPTMFAGELISDMLEQAFRCGSAWNAPIRSRSKNARKRSVAVGPNGDGTASQNSPCPWSCAN